MTTLGNLGEGSDRCRQSNLRYHDSLSLKCESGTVIQEMYKFGIQKAEAAPDDNICQIAKKNSTQFVLDLDEECSLDGFMENHEEHYDLLMQ